MPTDWLSASNFQRVYELLTAINTLSIHTKLALAGRTDITDVRGARDARTSLRQFLQELDALLRTAAQQPGGTLLGADPRLGALALAYQSEQQKSGRHSALADLPFRELDRLLVSEDRADFPVLIRYLRELRSLLEQQAQADVSGILGEP
jgi:hypothetical protein